MYVFYVISDPRLESTIKFMNSMVYIIYWIISSYYGHILMCHKVLWCTVCHIISTTLLESVVLCFEFKLPYMELHLKYYEVT
jgi:hypothetical protein